MSIAHTKPNDGDDLGSLLERVRSGDPDANETLFRRFHRFVYAIALERLDEVKAAEDATQEVFKKAIGYILTYRKAPTYFIAWLARIAHNHCTNIATRERKPDSLNALEGTEREPTSRDVLPEEQVIAAEGCECLRAAIERLSPKRRAAFLLFHVHGCSYEEIAQIMGCNISTVGAHLTKARKILRNDPILRAWYAETEDKD